MNSMLQLSEVNSINSPACLILTNGFEDRVAAGAKRLLKAGARFDRILVVRYPGKEHDETYQSVVSSACRLVERPNRVYEIRPTVDDISLQLAAMRGSIQSVVCDVSGLSRALMLRILTRIWRQGYQLTLVYTEAKEYYPLRADFAPFLEESEKSAAFIKLGDYEAADIVYSSECRVEEIDELPGAIFPNHPLMVISFFTFKRSRLSAVLNQYESNARVLIEGEPVRKDLKWRKSAMEIINFDLFSENKGNIITLPTLYWDKTYEYLSSLYKKNSAGYRFNVILAPLGGKMQTVGAWYFAVKHPDVKVVTSTPAKLYPEKYSKGYAGTHVIRIPNFSGEDLK